MVDIKEDKFESLGQERSIDVIFQDIQGLDPRPIDAFKASNADEQRQQFLAGEIRNPSHEYPAVEVLDFDAINQKLDDLRQELESHSGLDEDYRQMYLAFIDRYRDIYTMMAHSHALRRQDIDHDAREHARAEFMRLNSEIYRAPERDVYMSHIAQLRRQIEAKDVPLELQNVRNELFEQLPVLEDGVNYGRYQPSQEIVDKMHRVVMVLLGRIQGRVPNREGTFSPEDIGKIFREIIEKDFGEAGEGWTVEVIPAYAVSVNPAKKIITIPNDRLPATAEVVRGLVVHELGTHFLRAVMGESTDLPLMTLGFPGYSDFEEGVAMVAEEALKGKYKDEPNLYYIAAGMAADGADFRSVHEVMWRIKLLSSKKYADDPESAIIKAKSDAYLTTRRIFRGADELPWFKDLSYSRGKERAWRYFENCFGLDGEVDDMAILFAFLGRIDSSDPEHRRTALETRT